MGQNGENFGEDYDTLKQISGLLSFFASAQGEAGRVNDGLAGDPAYVFNVTDFAALDKTTNAVVNAVDCQKKCGADIVFVLEASELVGTDGMAKVTISPPPRLTLPP